MKELKYITTIPNKEKLSNIFVPTKKNWISTENENLSIIETGQDKVLMHKMVKAISKATEMVCLQSFLIQDTQIIDALLNAKDRRNIKIYILDSAEARLQNDRFEEDESFATKDYKKMLDEKFKYNFIHRQANHLHAKFILIDPRSNPKGYLFTGNFNEKPFCENPELGVELSKDQVNELFKTFVYHFWEYTTHEQREEGKFESVKPTGKFQKPDLSNILITSPDKELSNLKRSLLESVIRAKNEIAFSTFGFDITHELSQEILKKLKSGVNVKVFCRTRKKAMEGHIAVLAQNGAKVICHPLIHAKSLIVDHNEAFVFTANFEKHGMDEGFEVGLKLNDLQTKDLQLIYKNWEETFPYRFAVEEKISDIEEYLKFNESGKTTTVLIEKDQKVSYDRSIVKVEDIISFINQEKTPRTGSAQNFMIEKIMKINDAPSDFNVNEQIIPGFEIISYKREQKSRQKGKKKESGVKMAVLLTITMVNIPQFLDFLKDEDYVGFNVFAKNEGN